MKIEIHIDNVEIDDIIFTLKEQGIDVTRMEVEAHIEEYIQGAVEDSRHERMDCIVDSLLDLQDWFLYTERMKNNEPINGSIIEAVTVRSGVHQYDEKNRTVVEIAFKGYNTNYIQVVDFNTARSLMNQLRDILPPNYQEL